ncbi:CD1375 family protein [Fictibacillus phosphorivorans]|nr:CD1375 family protein [Fictibacillus phosphorivorans]
MVVIYFKLVKAGVKTIEEVPEIHRAEVQEMLDREISTEV